MSVAETTWAEIRRAYEAGPDAVARLSERFSVSASRIYRRAKKDGWRRQSSPGPAPPIAKRIPRNKEAVRPSAELLDQPVDPAASSPDGGGRRPVNRQAMIARLYQAIDENLKRLEARMGSGREISAADSERETRELGVMIRSFEKVTEFATEIENRRQSAAPERVSATDAERMRAEIAERLERLHAQGHPGAGSGEDK